MLIPRKGKGQLEIYKCKLGIHDWLSDSIGGKPDRNLEELYFHTKEVERGLSIIISIVREPIVESVVKRKRGMRTKNVEVVKDRWTDGLALEISHNGWQTTSISNLDVEDLKRIRKVIRKAIRNHENNKSV